MRRLALVVFLLAAPALAAGTGLPVDEPPMPPLPPPYEPPVRPPPFVPPPPAPIFRPDFPPPRVIVAPAGPARPVTGTVCVVPAARHRPALRCDAARAAIGAACRCDGRAGRVRVR